MRIIFFDTKNYDRAAFDLILNSREYADKDLYIEYMVADLDERTAHYCGGYQAVCAFVNSVINANVLNTLKECGVKLLLMRCAGFNNIDLEAAKACEITILRVPAYSPEAVAEHAMALALSVNRKIHKAYIKVRENNFSLSGLTGFNFYNKTAGIIGTGKIGAAMCRICNGFGMRVLAYDQYENSSLDFVTYVSLDELLSTSDLISIHCPLTPETTHLINRNTISKMKDGVILVNTSRGAIVSTNDLIKGIRDMKFHGVGLDVYEEEGDYVYENMEDDILKHSTTARLLSFPNVIVTSHQGFLTKEALSSIASITLENALDYTLGRINQERIVM